MSNLRHVQQFVHCGVKGVHTGKPLRDPFSRAAPDGEEVIEFLLRFQLTEFTRPQKSQKEDVICREKVYD